MTAEAPSDAERTVMGLERIDVGQTQREKTSGRELYDATEWRWSVAEVNLWIDRSPSLISL